MEDCILTLEEVSRHLKVNKATVYRMAQTGRIPALKVGKVWRFQQSKVTQWMAEHSNETRVASKPVEVSVASEAA